MIERLGAVAAVAVVCGALAGVVIGLVTRGVVDESFVRDFWTGPPAAGIFALIGAGLAYGAATVAARVSRRSAERQEWWDRAKWALSGVHLPEVDTIPTRVDDG